MSKGLKSLLTIKTEVTTFLLEMQGFFGGISVVDIRLFLPGQRTFGTRMF